MGDASKRRVELSIRWLRVRVPSPSLDVRAVRIRPYGSLHFCTFSPLPGFGNNLVTPWGWSWNGVAPLPGHTPNSEDSLRWSPFPSPDGVPTAANVERVPSWTKKEEENIPAA